MKFLNCATGKEDLSIEEFVQNCLDASTSDPYSDAADESRQTAENVLTAFSKLMQVLGDKKVLTKKQICAVLGVK